MLNFIAKEVSYQGDDEDTICLIHRHWFDILSSFFLVFLMIAFLIASHLVLPSLFPNLQTVAYYNLFLFSETSFAMLILVIFFFIWIDYYFDTWIITNKRIINIEQHGLFSREVNELELNKIQDVSSEVFGILPTFLNYGNILIQTAGEQERFVFKKIPRPYEIKDLIMRLEKINEVRIEKVKAMSEAHEIRSAFQDTDFRPGSNDEHSDDGQTDPS